VESAAEDEVEELEEIDEIEELDDSEQFEEFEEGEEPEELEELGNVEEPNDAEEVFELDDSPAEPAKTPSESRRPVLALNDIASQIEFGGTGYDEHESEEAGLNENLEIVSPFTTMFSRIDSRGGIFDTELDEGALEELGAEGLFLMYQPFQFRNEAIQDGLLDCGNSGETEIIAATETGETEIIHEKDGITYVNTGAAPDEATERSLDPGLKNLVDSVMNGKL
jgi:hypothetical protein